MFDCDQIPFYIVTGTNHILLWKTTQESLINQKNSFMVTTTL